MREPTISFDASFCFLSGFSRKIELKLINECLSWVDLKIQMQNKMNPYFSKDPIRYCYNSNQKKFPTGILNRVCNWLDQQDIKYTVKPISKSLTNIPTPLNQPVPDWAWEHQKELVSIALKNKRCIIQSPTGSGY